MKRIITTLAVIGALALPGIAHAECVSSDLLAWVDNREANAISPARWQAVRNSLLGQDGGMPLADMQVIYDRRVSNGWSAGHWVPIIGAMECLEQAEEVEEEVLDPAPAEEPETAQTEEAQPAEEPKKIAFKRPPDDDTDAANYDWIVSGVPGTTRPYKMKRVHRGTVNDNWYPQYQAHQSPGAVEPNEAFKTWASEYSTSIAEGMDDWGKWGPWDDLNSNFQSWIEGTLGRSLASWDGLIQAEYGVGGDLGEQGIAPKGNPNIQGGKAHWRGTFERYQVHRDATAAGFGKQRAFTNGSASNERHAPTMVFEATFGDDRNPGQFSAFIDWPLLSTSRTTYLKGHTPAGAGTDSLTVSWEHTNGQWIKTEYENTTCRCDTWTGIDFTDGTYDDGELSATFYKTDANTVTEFRRDNSAIAGHVRRAKIIGEFFTGEGKAGSYP